jgi:hypothetical protein
MKALFSQLILEQVEYQKNVSIFYQLWQIREVLFCRDLNACFLKKCASDYLWIPMKVFRKSLLHETAFARIAQPCNLKSQGNNLNL